MNMDSLISQLLFQSTLPHGSDRISPLFLFIFFHISIHAPSRERQGEQCDGQICCYFNPRSLTGATSIWVAILLCTIISIHAPSRERRAAARYLKGAMGFQSTLPRGSDLKPLPRPLVPTAFQSTLPRGSDITENTLKNIQLDFNPRSLAGATSNPVWYIQAISIHAPSRERRRPFLWPRQSTGISIHAPSRERPTS